MGKWSDLVKKKKEETPENPGKWSDLVRQKKKIAPHIPSIRRQVMEMIKQNKSQDDINSYLSSWGLTTEDLREEKRTFWRSASETAGGAMAGAAAVATGAGAAMTPLAIGLGSAIAGQGYDLIQEQLGKKVPETPLQRAETSVEDIFLNAVSPVAISKGIYIGKKFGQWAYRLARGHGGREAADAVFERVGVKPSASMVRESKGLAGVEEGLSKYAITSDIMQKPARKRMADYDFAGKWLAEQFGEVLNREELGLLLKSGAEEALESMKALHNKLSNEVANQVEAVLPITKVNNTIKAAQQLIKESELGANSGVSSWLQDFLEKVQKAGGEGLPWRDLNSHRRDLGERLRSPLESFLPSMSSLKRRDMKFLYKALIQDLEKGTIAADSSGLVNANWRAMNARIQHDLIFEIPVVEEILREKVPENVLDIVLKFSRKGGSRLDILKKQFPGEQWDKVVASTLYEMGMERSGATESITKGFSPRTFLTRYKDLSDLAKKRLFRNSKYNHLQKELDDFLTVSSRMVATEKMANVSNTGPIIAFYGIMSGLGALTGGIVAGQQGVKTVAATAGSLFLSSRAMAKLMTSPTFIKWLAGGIKISKTDPNAMSTHLGRLMFLRFKESENIQNEVDEVINFILKREKQNG